MPELPEIFIFARDMQKELLGRTITGVEVLQPKCLNVPVETFQSALTGAQIVDVSAHGKWLKLQTTRGWLLLCLGMGGEILLTQRQALPEKYRLIFDLDGENAEAALVVNFWWFGYAHYVTDPAEHPMVGKLGPDVLNLSQEQFRALLGKRRGAIKAFLLDQSRVAGIGNVYVQDPLFKARVHPLRTIDSLSEEEIAALWQALRETLQESIDRGGSFWELNLYGQKGGWGPELFLVAYSEEKPCPVCGTTTIKIKTGSTSSYICPACQPLGAGR